MRIDRCVCMERSFAEAVELRRREGLSLEQIETRLGCGTGCGLCRPYVRRALRTGQTVFHELICDREEPPAD